MSKQPADWRDALQHLIERLQRWEQLIAQACGELPDDGSISEAWRKRIVLVFTPDWLVEARRIGPVLHAHERGDLASKVEDFLGALEQRRYEAEGALMHAERWSDVQAHVNLTCQNVDEITSYLADVVSFEAQTRPKQETTLANASKADATPDTTPPDDAPLSPTQRLILPAMLAQGAVEADRLTTADNIAKRISSHANGEDMKRAMADLRKRGLVESRPGGGGGSWLTAEGARRAKALN